LVLIASVHSLQLHDVTNDAATCHSKLSKHEIDKRLLNEYTNILLEKDTLCGLNLTVRCITVPVDTMKTYRGVEVQLHSFLTSVLEVSGQLHASAVLLLVPTGQGKNGPQKWCGHLTREKRIRKEIRPVGYGLLMLKIGT
jgi:hypothetical protein